MSNLISFLRNRNYEAFLLNIKTIEDINLENANRLLFFFEKDLNDSYNMQRGCTSESLFETAIRVLDSILISKYLSLAKKYVISDEINSDWRVISNCRKIVYILVEAWENKFELSQELEEALEENMPNNLWLGREGFQSFETEIKKLKRKIMEKKKDESKIQNSDFPMVNSKYQEDKKIFISYANEDFMRIEPIYEKLKAEGYKPWMDKKDLLPGEDWKVEIDKQINNSDYFILFLSKKSVTKRGYLQKEIKVALDKKDEFLPSDIYFIPVLLEKCELPERIQDIQYLEFEKEGFKKLKKAVEKGIKKRNSDFITKESETVTNRKTQYGINKVFLNDELLKSINLFVNDWKLMKKGKDILTPDSFLMLFSIIRDNKDDKRLPIDLQNKLHKLYLFMREIPPQIWGIGYSSQGNPIYIKLRTIEEMCIELLSYIKDNRMKWIDF